MKRLIRWAARLYPKAWRERYGVEFAALLEDVEPEWRTSLDIVRGALAMQMTSWSPARILAVSGMAGALVAFGVSFRIPPKYVSYAVVKITPGPTPALTNAAIGQEVRDHINSMSLTILSRSGVAAIINKFGLYQRERSRIPLEDVAELMKKNILIRPLAAVDDTHQVPAFVVQFSHEDRFLAQRVTQDLVARYIDENFRAASAALPITLETIDPASLPVIPVSPRPSRITAMGLAIGLALGALGAYVRNVTRPTPAPSGTLEKNPAGTPVFRGTGVPVHALLEYLETDRTLAQFLNDYPAVTREAAVSALELAKLSWLWDSTR